MRSIAEALVEAVRILACLVGGQFQQARAPCAGLCGANSIIALPIPWERRCRFTFTLSTFVRKVPRPVRLGMKVS